MTLRPIPARWFELVTVRTDLARTVERLSRTGAVELETQGGPAERLLLPDLDERMKVYHEAASRYRAYWPPAAPEGKRRPEHVVDMLDSAFQRLAAWGEEADPLVASLDSRSKEAGDLERLREALTRAGDGFADLELLAGAGPRLQVRLLQLPAGTMLREPPALVLLSCWQTPSANYVLAVGRPADVGELEAQLPGFEGRVVPLPAWLPSSMAETIPAISKRLVFLEKETESLHGELAALSERLQIARALGDIALVDWLGRYARDLRGSERLAWITGWTNDAQGTALQRALDEQGVRYVLRLSDAAIGANAPMLLSNPRWARIFEIFARMLGTPGRNEADPSLVLAIIAPLIFGFMFGDVGQGFVIFVTGLVLGRRIPLARLLVPGGIMAIGFGVLFGSVFCRQDLISASWVHPLADPAVLLIAAVSIGVAILSIGMALDAVQGHWRGEGRRWWGCRVGLPFAYFGLLVSPMQAEGPVLFALGAAWYIFGSAILAEKRKFVAVVRGTAEFTEQSLRLLVNTVSFARVGAFALAHAGLAAAVVDVAQASGPIIYWFVLALGNLLVVGLEGLVVSIQATRLMLFEFFIRFLTADGRDFKALPPPEIAETNLLLPRLRGAP